MNPFDLFNKNEGESQRKRNDLKTALLQVGTLGGAGYAASKLLDGSKLKDSIAEIKNNSVNERELGTAGNTIREQLDVLQANLKQNIANNLKDSILEDNRIEEILDGTRDPSERRALLASLFDSYKMEVGSVDDISGMGDLLKRYYESGNELNTNDLARVKDFYKTNIGSSEDSKARFNARYKRTMSVSDLLDDGMLKPGLVNGVREINTNSIGKNTNVFNKFKEFQNVFGSSNVSLVERDAEKLGKVTEVKINQRGGGKVPLFVPLKAARTAFGTPVYSGTSSGATLYSGPMQMLDALELKKSGFKKTSAGNIPGLRSFEDYIAEQVLKVGRSTGGNLDRNNINELYSFMRSLGTDLPKSTVQGGSSVSDTLLTSKAMEGSNIFITNVDESGMSSKQVVSHLLTSMPDTFGGPPSSQTVTTRISDPMDRNKSINLSQVQLMKLNGNKTLNPLNQLLPFGRDGVDRALLPQTARETQMLGRYEYLSSEKSTAEDYKIGKNNNINVFAKNTDLLGISPTRGAEIRGANLAMFMVLGDEKSAQLGLSEGSAYSGGRFSATTGLTKTVSQQGVEKFRLMTLLEEIEENTNIDKLQVGTFDTDKTAGKYNIDDFFNRFGKNGEAILGYRDSGFSVIKRHKGMTSFDLKISGRSEAGGTRSKIHLSGEAVKGLEHMKLFSGGFKGTLEYADRSMLSGRLTNMGLDEQYGEFSKYASHEASIFTDESMIKKSAHYLGMQIYGGFKFFGGDTDKLTGTLKSKIGDDDDYLKMIRAVQSGADAADIDSASVKSRQGGFLKAMIESVLEKKGAMSDKEVGMVLGGVQKLGTKFGLEQKEIDALIKNSSDNILLESKKGVAVGAMYATSGDVYSDLGRNLARVEPRFANYMYSSLRSNFGFSGDEASNYISSLISRQEGATEKAQAALGMKLSAFSMSDLSEIDVQKNLMGVENIKNIAASEVSDILDLVGNEKELGDKLSESKSGSILKTNQLGLSKKAQAALEKSLAGKQSLFLAGSDTYEGLKGHIIRSQGEDLNIANEYLRYTNDLLASIGNLRDAGEDEDKIRSGIRGFETSKKNLGRVTADTFRNVLSGKVLGSGTYRGRGISLGKGGAGNIGGKIMEESQRKLMGKVFDKTGGYALVADAQAFMDGMSTFEEAARRDAMRSSGKTDVKQEVQGLMNKTLRNFFLGIYEAEPVGVTVDAQRNPIIGMGNIFANIEMFSSGDNQEVFDRHLKSQVEKSYIKNDATGARREQIFKEEKQKLQAEIKKANLEREKASLIKLSNDGKYQKALNYKNNELDGFLESKKAIKTEAKRLGFSRKNARKNFFKFVNGFMGSEQLDDLAERAGRDTDVGKAYLKVQRDGSHQALKSTYQSDSSNIGKAIKNYNVDKYQQYNATMADLRNTQEYKGNKKGVSDVFDRINANTNDRMVSENVFETEGTVKGNKMFQRLRSMEEAFIGTGSASDDFENRGVGERFRNFEEIFEAEQAVIKTGSAEDIDSFNTNLSKTLSSMQKNFIREGSQGGGTVSFFDVKVKDAQLLGKDNKVIGSYSGRADINRAGIGDFDGDIYQVFFRTDKASIEAARTKATVPKQMFNQSMSMGIMLDQLTQGMKNLGERMGAGDMNLVASQISEKEKERILKGVGGVDIEVKTLMMGMAQAASDAGDQKEYFKSMKAGMAVMSAMQEQLVIQAKKLPMASNVPEAFTKALRSGFKTGSGEQLKRFLTEHVLQGTDLLKAGSLTVGEVSFENIDETSGGGQMFKSGIQGTTLNLDEIFETLDKGFATVKSYGLNKMPSTSRMMKQLSEGRVADLQMLSNLLSSSMTMEGGVVGGGSEAMSELERIMLNAESSMGKIKSSFAQRAGAMGIAGGLIASGAIGTMMSPGELNPEGVFSDMRVRENMSMRNLQENMGREHGNVSPQRVGGPQDNFHERPILSGETSVISNTSTRFYGEAASMGAGVSMARQFASVGGQSSMHINDTRLPISNSYITKSIRD